MKFKIKLQSHSHFQDRKWPYIHAYASRLVVKSAKGGLATVGSGHLCVHSAASIPLALCIGWLYSDHGHIGNLAKGR